jgi:membrane protease YdiL (CAAX protease family)
MSVLTGNDEQLRATWRILISFVVFFGILLIANTVLRPLPWPDVLVNLPSAIPAFVGVLAVLAVSTRLFDTQPLKVYGLEVGRSRVRDLLAGIVIGCLFQGLTTVVMIQLGTGRIVTVWSPLVEETGAVVVAFGATVVGFLIVALWEELMFRAVLIRNAAEGFVSRGAKRRSATIGAVLLGSLLFGSFHSLSAIEGGSPAFAVLQATTAGLYFGFAYVLSGNLALPIGIHLSTNVWVVSVFGQSGTGFPALVRFDRSLEIGWETVPTFLFPTVVLFALILGWVFLTQGSLTWDGIFSERTED